eukprot:XP_001696735.1 predicted protein [Chlamydomonas reinhardtii]
MAVAGRLRMPPAVAAGCREAVQAFFNVDGIVDCFFKCLRPQQEHLVVDVRL